MDQMAAKIPDRIVEQVAVVGNLKDAGRIVRERYTGVVDRIAYYYPVPEGDSVEKWRTFTDAARGTA